MASIYWLIPLSLVILAVAIYIFFWAVKDGQYDDLDSEATRILFEEDTLFSSSKTSRKNDRNN